MPDLEEVLKELESVDGALQEGEVLGDSSEEETPESPGDEEHLEESNEQSEGVKEVEEVPEKLTKSYEDLEKRFKKLREEQSQIKEQSEKLKQFDALAETVQSDPMKALRMMGIDPYDISDSLLGGKGPKKEEPDAKTLVEELREELRTLREERGRDKTQNAIKEWHTAIKSAVSTDPDRWEILHGYKNDYGMLNKVLKEVVDFNNENGRAPGEEDMSVILDRMEGSYEEEIFTGMSRVSKLKKMKSKIDSLLTKEESNASSHKEGKTLSNSHQGQPPSKIKPKSEEERRRIALDYLTGARKPE